MTHITNIILETVLMEIESALIRCTFNLLLLFLVLSKSIELIIAEIMSRSVAVIIMNKWHKINLSIVILAVSTLFLPNKNILDLI